jgi:hypothetical protein
MKRIILTIITLTAIVGILATSFTYPVDVTKDGITVRVYNEQDRSEKLQSHNLACLYVRIKNDTNGTLELPKYAIASPLLANEKIITDIMSSTPKEVGKFVAKFLIGTGLQGWACFFIAHNTWDYYRDITYFPLIHYPCRIGCIASPLTGATWAITSYLNQAQVSTMLQEYLDRRTTTIHMNSEYGFYIYIDLDQYARSIGKNITVRLHKRGSEEVLLFEVDTTGLVQTQIT